MCEGKKLFSDSIKCSSEESLREIEVVIIVVKKGESGGTDPGRIAAWALGRVILHKNEK